MENNNSSSGKSKKILIILWLGSGLLASFLSAANNPISADTTLNKIMGFLGYFFGVVAPGAFLGLIVSSIVLAIKKDSSKAFEAGVGASILINLLFVGLFYMM